MRKLLKRSAVIALAIFAAAEIGLRSIDAIRGRGWSSPERRQTLEGTVFTSPRIFCQFRPPAGARYRVPGAEIAINRLGMRGEEVARPKAAGTFRVICLGGSTTFDQYNGAGIHWPLLLERKLRERLPGRRIEVLNAGVNGWSSAHSLAWFLFDGLALEPDAIFVHHLFNDLSVNFHGDPLPDYSNKYGIQEWEPRPEGRRILLDHLFGWSEAYLWTRLVTYRLVTPHRHVEVLPYEAARGLPAAAYYRRNLENLCAVARANGVKVVFGLEPEDILRRYDRTLATQLGLCGKLRVPDAEVFRSFHGEYVRIIREVAARNGAALADADREMSGRGEYFVDVCHTNLAGSEKLAEVVLEGILPLVPPQTAGR